MEYFQSLLTPSTTQNLDRLVLGLAAISALHTEAPQLSDNFVSFCAQARKHILSYEASTALPALCIVAAMNLPEPRDESLSSELVSDIVECIQRTRHRVGHMSSDEELEKKDVLDFKVLQAGAQAMLLLSGTKTSVITAVSLLTQMPVVESSTAPTASFSLPSFSMTAAAVLEENEQLLNLLTYRQATSLMVGTSLYPVYMRALHLQATRLAKSYCQQQLSEPTAACPFAVAYPNTTAVASGRVSPKDAVKGLARAGLWMHASSLLVFLNGGSLGTLDLGLGMLNSFLLKD